MDDVIEDEVDTESEDTSEVTTPFSLDLSEEEDEETNPLLRGTTNMTAIVWDDEGNKKFEAGCDRGVFYPIDESGKYTPGVAWNGLTTVTESPSGAEATKSYADNIAYLTMISAEEYEQPSRHLPSLMSSLCVTVLPSRFRVFRSVNSHVSLLALATAPRLAMMLRVWTSGTSSISSTTRLLLLRRRHTLRSTIAQKQIPSLGSSRLLRLLPVETCHPRLA